MTGHIAPEAWRAMSEAARQAGQPLDQWLKEQLLASNAGAVQTANAVGGTVEDLQRRVQELSGVIDRLVSAAPAAAPAAAFATTPAATAAYPASEPAQPGPPPAESRLDAALRQINERLDSISTPRSRPAVSGGAAGSVSSSLVSSSPSGQYFDRRASEMVRTAEHLARAGQTPEPARTNLAMGAAMGAGGAPASSPMTASAVAGTPLAASALPASALAAVPRPEAIEAAVAEIAARQHELERMQETARQETARQESARQENAREAARQERAKEAARLEHARLEAVRREAARERHIPSPSSVPPIPGVPPISAAATMSQPGAPSPRGLLINDQITALQRELVEMRESIGTLAPRRAVDELQRTVARLADRAERAQIGDEELRGTLGSLREMIGAIKLPEHPAVLTSRIETLERKIDILNAKSVDGASIARLQAQASEIRDLIGRALSTDALRLLAEQVALLAGKVSQMPVVDEAMIRSAVGSLERRIDHLADRIGNQPAPTLPLGDIFGRLDLIQNGLASVQRDVPASVEPLIRGLADRIERIERPVSFPDHGPRFDALSRQVAEIASRLDAAGDPATKIGGQLATIERAVNDLFIQMEETRATILANAGHRARPSGSQLLKREIAAIEANRAAAGAAQPTSQSVAPQPTAPVSATPVSAAPVSPASSPQGSHQSGLPDPVFAPAPASIPKPFEPQLMRAALEELSRSPDVATAFAQQAQRLADEAAAQVAVAHTPVAPTPVAEARAPEPETAPVLSRAPADGRGQGPAFEPDEASLLGALGDEDPYALAEPLQAARDLDAETDGAPSRTQFIAQARRASQPASVVLPEMHSRIGERHHRAKPVSAGRRWLARIRATLLIGMCGSALAYGSWHLLTTMREAQLRANAPAAPGAAPRAIARPSGSTAAPGSLPSPEDITGSIGAPRSVTPAPAIPVPEMVSPGNPFPDLSAPAGEPATPPGPSSLSAPSDLPGSIGSQGLRSAALAGDAAAAFEIGRRFMEGTGVPPSAARAADWFEFAAAQGSVPAAYRLGAIYEKGVEGVARDVARARQLYEQAASAGNVRAMHNLGVLLAAGVDGQPDYRTAALWFTRAAERGVRDSQYNLAVLYARGFGIAVDAGEAWRWFSLAAAAGDAEAAKKRDEIAARLDASTLASQRAAIAKWTPSVVDAKANGSDWTTDGNAPRKTASR